MIIRSLGQAFRERIYECSDAAHHNFHTSVRPLFAASKGHNLKHIGSCLLLQVDGINYVATAAHITDNIPQHELYVIGTEHTEPVQLVGIIYSTQAPDGDRSRDKLDIAFTSISVDAATQLGTVTFINADEVSHNRVNLERRLYMAIGYPISKNRGKVNHNEHWIKTVSWRYVAGVENVPALAEEMTISGDDHLFLRYDKYSKDAEGRKVSSVSPRGLSGGAMVDLGDVYSMDMFESATPFAGRLAGMVIEMHKTHRALVAVRIQKIIQAIRQGYRSDHTSPIDVL